ncbi:MAG: two-component system heavy metal sensor histidine kinase CusS [Candidatus Omnitrophota bacterium]|jgi:two-component system heavy metal sensor histidine kinase CusS
MRLSFRSKIALGSVLFSGVILGLSGVAFLKIIHSLGLERIDREAQALGEGTLSRQHGALFWSEFGETFQNVVQPSRNEQWTFGVSDIRGRLLYQSEGLPDVAMTAMEAWAHLRTTSPDVIDPAIRDHINVIRQAERLSEEQMQALIHDVEDMFVLGATNLEIEEHVRRIQRRLTGLPLGGQASRQGRRTPAQATPIPSTYRTILSGQDAWRVAFMGNELVNLVVAVDLAPFEAQQRYFRNVFLMCSPFALLLLGIGGRFIAGRALRPVGVIAKTIDEINASELSQRIPAFQADLEFEQLTGTLNNMLARLERGFHQATRFTADAAHELNSPLAVLQGELDRMIHQAPEDSEEQRGYHNLLEEVQRLKGVTHKLLLLARADAGQLPLDKQSMNISELATNTVEDAEVIAGPITVSAAILPNIKIAADQTLIRQVINNLLTNAIKYNRKQDGWIQIGLNKENGRVQFSVTSSGEGLENLDTEKIFERFYRADSSRKRDGFGAGLGLSISREIARAHGGDLRVENLSDASVTFVLSLPES